MTSVDIIIPVLNEEQGLVKGVTTLRDFLLKNLPGYKWRIVVADNGSKDGTLDVAKSLSKQYPDQVSYIHLPEKGRGRALRKAWLESPADIVSYMDVDLSTGLEAFPKLVDALDKEEYHIAIGSRLIKGSVVKQRTFKRELTSRTYNFMIRMMFWPGFHDAQCGFKAVKREAAQKLIPLIKDQAWFFDTELLLLGKKKGYKIKEIPVTWIDDPDSRVKVARTAWEDVKGLFRVRFRAP